MKEHLTCAPNSWHFHFAHLSFDRGQNRCLGKLFWLWLKIWRTSYVEAPLILGPAANDASLAVLTALRMFFHKSENLLTSHSRPPQARHRPQPELGYTFKMGCSVIDCLS